MIPLAPGVPRGEAPCRRGGAKAPGLAAGGGALAGGEGAGGERPEERAEQLG